MAIANNITVIAAVNNQDVLEKNLLRSPLLNESDLQYIQIEGHVSASQAFNHAIKKATGELLVFAHQDVYLPLHWGQQLFDAVAKLEKSATTWTVLGVVGVGVTGQVQGLSWSTGLLREVGSSIREPQPAVSLDELVLVVRKSSGLSFDERLPGWHLYGTDIVQEAIRRNLGAYIIKAPVIHNSVPVVRFDAGFAKCYQYMRRKWNSCLPLQSCCIKITRYGWPLLKKQIRQFLITTNRHTFVRLPNPAEKAKALGYE